MKYKNSFFRLQIEDDGTYLVLYPAYTNGKKLEANEIIDFVEKKGLVDYNRTAILDALKTLLDEQMKVKISDMKIDVFDESAEISITPDRMIAAIRFYPPSNGGKFMDKKGIIAELERVKITHGIQENIIDVFLKARQYCLNIPIAKGKKPVPATDTKIEYMFDTKPLAKPKILEDGSVDFHELSLFTKVKKGDLLAKLTPHTMGEDGNDIFGVVIPPNKPKILKLKYGRNITLSEDKCSITSDVDGNVTLTDDTVFVSDTYEVPADVDVSTGDIDYDGSVLVTGNVRTGFTIKAKGDIQVNGVVEGATLIADGNIVIKRGMQGINKGSLYAGGDVCANFFESATVEAKGDVTVGSILHSRILAGNKVVVKGRKGFIIGGEVICGNYVEANSIGNKVETQTIIKVGVNPELYDELKGLIGAINEYDTLIEENESYLNVFKEKMKKGVKLSPENIKSIKQYQTKIDEINAEKSVKTDRLSEIRKVLDVGRKGSIKVMGNTYRGVSLFISSCTYITKDTDSHSWYRITEGEIKSVPF